MVLVGKSDYSFENKKMKKYVSKEKHFAVDNFLYFCHISWVFYIFFFLLRFSMLEGVVYAPYLVDRRVLATTISLCEM